MTTTAIPSAFVAGDAAGSRRCREGLCAAENGAHVGSAPARAQVFIETQKCHRAAQADTNEYLEKTVAKPLSHGLAALALRQPLDSVDYLIQWLRRYADNEEKKQVLAAERAELLRVRAQMKTMRQEEGRAKAEKAAMYGSDGLTREDRAVLDSLDHAIWLSEKEFQRILDYLKSALGVEAAYMVRLREDAESNGAVLQYVGADSGSTFLVDMTLNEEEGVLWHALSDAAEPEISPREDHENSESDDESADETEDKQDTEVEAGGANGNESQPQGDQPQGKVGTPLVIPDVMADERIKFWKLVRPGSLAAVSLTYDDPANKVNVDTMREYLLEVRNRENIIKEDENARKQAASTGGLQSKRTTLESNADADAESSDGEADDEHPTSENENTNGVPAPVTPPTYTCTPVKMVFCIDTLGMEERVSPPAVTRLSKFVEAIQKHCIRTRLAAVRTQAENSMHQEQQKERAYEIEKGLENVEVEAAPLIEAEKTLAVERLEAQLEQEKEDRDRRKQEQQERAEDKKRRQLEKRTRKRPDASEDRQGDAQEAQSAGEEDGEEESADAGSEDDDFGRQNDDEDGSTEENDETAAEKPERQSGEDEDDSAETLDPTFFVEEAEAKVKYEKTCEFLCEQCGSFLTDLESMFIPLAASAKPIVAACLLLLGEPPHTLRVNSKVPQTDWDWEKLRSRLGASIVQRISSYNPSAPRPPPPPPPPRAASADTDVVVLQQIAQLLEEADALPEETTPLIETSPALFLLERWAKVAIDYRRKYLIVTAATLLRDAKRKKSPPPVLATEVDVDFQDLPLPSALLSTNE